MNAFQLKILACMFMVMDHIALFLPTMPVWMHWLGRLSAPLFLLLCGWSCVFTSNIRRYVVRLYAASVLMSFIDAALSWYMSFHALSGVSPDNNIFRTLFHTSLIIALLSDSQRSRKIRNLGIYALAQIAGAFVLELLSATPAPPCLFGMAEALLGSLVDLEGGLLTVMLGVSLWAVRESRSRTSLTLIAFSVFHAVMSATSLIPLTTKLLVENPGPSTTAFTQSLLSFLGIAFQTLGQSAFTVNYQWMMVFALPFMLIYNRRRGRSWKWFFYLFYPAHIMALFFLGQIIPPYWWLV